MHVLPPDAIGIEIDGDGVSPETTDPTSTLRLALSFIELVKAVADERDVSLSVQGLGVVDKCTAVLSRVFPVDAGRQCMIAALNYVFGDEIPPPGIARRVSGFVRARGDVPDGLAVSAFVGPTRRLIDIAAPRQGLPFSQLHVRATAIRVGGRDPTVALESGSETKPFTLRVDRAMACELAHHLYKQMDIEAVVTRAEDGLIESGTLRAFHPLDSGDPYDTWSSFFQTNGLRH